MQNSLQAMVQEYGAHNLRFFIPMRPLHSLGAFGGYTSSDDPMVTAECVIDETRYRIEDGHKITLRAVDTAYGSEHFYQMDFVSLWMEHPDHYRAFVLVDDDNKYHRLDRPRSFYCGTV